MSSPKVQSMTDKLFLLSIGGFLLIMISIFTFFWAIGTYPSNIPYNNSPSSPNQKNRGFGQSGILISRS